MNGDNRKDVGIKIAKPDFNVNTAGDIDLLLNSSWPTLQIAFETTVTGQTEISHGLGFAPFTLVWNTSGGITRKGVPDVNGSVISFDSFTFLDSGMALGSVHVKCYDVDISKDIEYPFVSPPSSTATTSPDFGLKMVKEGKDLSSTDLRDYLIHTRAQSPLVLAVKTEESSSEHPTQGRQIDYTSPYAFPSWVFGFVWIEADQKYTYAPYFSQSYPITRINSNSYNLQFLNGKASLVVLRDPFFASTNTEASY
jgi:hypothetical protein